MGEGWGDFLAISYFADAADDPAGPQPLGDYVTGDTVNGIRRYPYARDMALNPLTYADLCDNGSCQVHAEGEIWATTLWDARHDLIAVHGFEEGRHRIEQLVVDGLKMSPCNPNFLSMRDLILQASDTRYGATDTCTIRKAFARRGMGADAISNGTGSNASAGFDVTAPLTGLVSFSPDKVTLSWPVEPDASGYPVARGSFGGGQGGSFDNAACQGVSGAASYVDGELPGSGSGFYYLIAVDDGCAMSGYGSASDGTPRSVASCQ